METRINIRSFDFDGCLFNNAYLRDSDTKNRLIDANQKLIGSITEEILQQKYHKVIFMVGSNRQSLRIDDVNNREGIGSCFSALHQLCAEFQKRVYPVYPTECCVDQYLLADTYGKTTIGENYDKALKDDRDYKFSHWLFDDSKLTVLYAKIHKASSDHPEAEIIFDFYDDRYIKRDILQGLADFFNANKDLMPCNLTMRLHYYAGNETKDIAVISGTGAIDSNYHEHINLMIHSAGLSFHGNLKDSNHVLSQLLKGDALTNFKKQRQIKLDNSKNDDTYYSYPSPTIFYQRPDSPTTERFKNIYQLGNERTLDGMKFLHNTHCNIDLEKNNVTPIQKHAMEGHHEAVEFLLKGGCSPLSAAEGYLSAGYFASEDKTTATLGAISDVEMRERLLQAKNQLIENQQTTKNRSRLERTRTWF